MNKKLSTIQEALDYKCPTCEKCPAESDHTCPYRCEINDDNETVCNCCDDCQQNCAWEV